MNKVLISLFFAPQAGAPFDIMKLPKGALFRPPKAKIDNLNKIDFLGQAKVVSELSPDSERSTSPAPNRVSFHKENTRFPSQPNPTVKCRETSELY